MIWQLKVAFLVVLFWSEHYSIAQDCLQGGETTETQIPFDNVASGASQLPVGSQAIVPSYQILCCGQIMEWGTFVQPEGPAGVYTIHFQVWRPSPASGSGGGGDCYSLVGENSFQGLTFLPDNPIIASPLSSDRISIRPGDVLGYLVTSSTGGANGGIQLDPSFMNDVVLYADIGDNPLPVGTEACPVSIRPGGVLSRSTNAAPVFSVDISMSNCPPLPPPILMTSSSTRPAPQPSPTPTPPPQIPIPPPLTTPPAPQAQPLTTPTSDTDLPIIPSIVEPAMTDEIVPTSPRTVDTALDETDQPTIATIIIIAPSSTQSTTDNAVQMDSGSTFFPIVIGVVATIVILTPSLLTLLVVMAIIKRKVAHKHELNENQDRNGAHKSSDILTDTNPAYSYHGDKETLPTPSHEQHKQVNVELTQNEAYIATDIPVEPNECYSSSVDLDQLYASVKEEDDQQDMELTGNQAYAANIQVETNECYDATTPSADPDQLNTAVKGGHKDTTHTSQRLTVLEYDYIMP